MFFTSQTRRCTCRMSPANSTCSFTGQTLFKSMENKQIIKKVTQPTEWVNALVCVEKPTTGKLHVCLDPKALNDNILRPHYPMRTIEDVTARLSGAKYFSVLDATKGYLSIKLTDESSYSTVLLDATDICVYLWEFAVLMTYFQGKSTSSLRTYQV
jgi:hypothetical protein